MCVCMCVCKCEDVQDTHAKRPPSCWPVSLPAWALPGVRLGANLAVQMGCKFSLQNYGIEVLAPFFKQSNFRLLIYIVIC